MVNKNYSFEKSYRELSINASEQVKKEIMTTLEIDSNQMFYLRKKQWRNIPYHAYKEIERIFKENGFEGEIFVVTDVN